MINIWNERFWKPMLLKELPKPFNHPKYIYEIKFDGIRAIIFASPKEFYIMSRNNKDLTNMYPELKSIQSLVTKKVIFDGEIIATEDGMPSFSKLQTRNHLKSQDKINEQAKKEPVNFIAFDILYENKNLTDLPLLKRKEILNNYKDTDVFIKTKYIQNEGTKLFKSVKNVGLEGIVAKNIDSKYHINSRTNDFIKIKNIQRDEFIIGGYIEKKNNVVSLLLGEYKKNKLVYVGKVTMGKKHELYQKLQKAKKVSSKFSNCEEEGIFVKPIYKCYVKYLERTKDNHLRHPVFQKYS